MASPHQRMRSRAQELRATGLTPLRTFWALRREFPNAERDTLVNASQLPGHHTGINPSWSEKGSLRPVICRWQKKKGAPR